MVSGAGEFVQDAEVVRDPIQGAVASGVGSGRLGVMAGPQLPCQMCTGDPPGQVVPR
jgi:hypothetical protein